MEHKKRIFIVALFESRLAKRGTRLPTLADMLDTRGHEVVYVTSNYSHARKEHYSDKEIATCRGLFGYRLVVLKAIGYKRHLSLARILTHVLVAFRVLVFLLKEACPGDIVVIQSRPPELLLAVSFVKTVKRLSVHMDITDIWPDMLREAKWWQYAPFWLYCWMQQKVAIPIFDTFSHCTPCAKPWLVRYAHRAESTFVPLGFDEDRWKDSERITRQTRCWKFVYVGTVTYHFDLQSVVRAFVDKDNLSLTIIGDGEYLPRLRQFVKEQGMNNVHLYGRVTPEEVVGILKDQDIGLSPEVSSVSTLPNKVFDFVGAGLPIVVMGECDSADFVRKHDIGWTLPLETNAMRSFVEGLRGEDVRVKYDNLQEVRGRYSKQRMYGELCELITNS